MAIASRFRDASATSRQNHRSCRNRAAIPCRDDEAAVRRYHPFDPLPQSDLDTGGDCCRNQSLEDRSCAVVDRKELARLLPLEQDAELLEECDRTGDWKGPEDFGDLIVVAVEVGGIDDIMGHVAASTAGDEDLCAEPRRAVEGHDAKGRTAGIALTTGEDRGHQPGSSRADDGDVDLLHGASVEQGRRQKAEVKAKPRRFCF